MTDAGRDGVGSVIAMQQAIGSEPTRILAASLRSADDITRLAAAFPGEIDSLTLARPTLEDVFIAKTGRRLSEESEIQ